MTAIRFVTGSVLVLIGCSAPPASSTADSGTPPIAPASVTAALMNNATHVTWVFNGAGESEFLIGRATVMNAMSTPAQTELMIIGSTPPDGGSYDDPDIELGKFYVYGVAARNAAGKSAYTLQTGSISLTPVGGACATMPITATDSDGDGLSDADEILGWMVSVDQDGMGTLVTRLVTSSPYSADTDGDGVCDRDESSLKLDPREADTDGDGLSDFDELNRWGSSPLSVDSDHDAHGNSAFYDGAELTNYGTSPTLDDTDGDGKTDFDEVNQNGTNPLAADLPQARLDVVSGIELSVNVMTTTGTTSMTMVTDSLDQSRTNTLSNTSSSSNTTSTETSYMVSVSASAGYPPSASVTAMGTYSAKEGYVQQSSSSIDGKSEQSSEQAYQNLSSQLVSSMSTVTGGTLALDFQVSNVGTRTFQLSNVVVTALRRDRNDPTTFTSIATLAFPMAANNLVLAEDNVFGPIHAQATVSASVALDLMSNPGTIFFQTASFDLVDMTGTDFAFTIGDTTASRTAELTIDYGGVRPIERYRVATNVERTSDGKAAGILLGDALSRIVGLGPGVGYSTAQRSNTGKTVLTRVRDVETTSTPDGGFDHFWVVIAPDNPDMTVAPAAQRLISTTKDFEDAQLMPRDQLTLAFVADHDGDGLFESEELAYGTSDSLADSDGDGLSDFEEVRQGWTVLSDNPFYTANPKVYSLPTVVDADGDGWDDKTEKLMGTDPNRADTDGDGLIDSVDPDPLHGPSGTWAQVYGTSGDETALQVLTQNGVVWVLGTSTGDIDNDGDARAGPFVMAVDADAGTQLWAQQLEASTLYSHHISLLPNDTVAWFTDVQPNVVPGITSHVMAMVEITRAGAVSATDLTNTPFNGATTLANQAPGTQEPTEDGGFITLGGYTQLGGMNALSVSLYTGLDARFTAGNGFGGVSGAVTVNESASNGQLTVATVFSAGQPAITYFEGASSPGGIAYGTNATHPHPPGKVAIDTNNALYIVNHGATDTLDRLGLSGIISWNEAFPGFVLPVITALDVDGAGAIYVGLQDASVGSALHAHCSLFVLQPDRSISGTFTLGNSSTQLVGSRRDLVGNLFAAGTTTGGFEPVGATQNHGGKDLVLVRNPQTLFAP